MLRLAPLLALLSILGQGAATADAQVATESVTPEDRQSMAQATGDAIGALPGIVRVGVATPLARGGAISAFAGYGFLGDILGLEDSHHRAAGQLSATLRLTEWLGFGVRFDGRYDKHSTSDGSDDGYVGDPRIIARAVRSLKGGVAIGGQLNVWLPGSEAPSLVTGAISAEALAMISVALPSSPLTLSGNLGFRLDNSAKAVEDSMALSLSDRLALGLSDSNAFLVGAGLSYRVAKAELLIESTYEYFVGDKAPPASRSPLEAAGGIRYHAAPNVQLQVYGRARLSKDPVVSAMSPLVPVSPRFGAMAGVHVQFGGPTPAPSRLVKGRVGDGQDDPDLTPDEPVKQATVAGRIVAGGAPISDAKVTLRLADGERVTVSSADGDYSFDGVPGDAGKLSVVVEIDGFKTSTSEVIIGSGETSNHDVEIDRILPPGSIRGIVRDFRGRPVIAKVKILPLGTVVEPDSDGVFTVPVAPGEYEVVVEHPNYQSQRKQVRVQQGTVTILNLDLQKP